MNKPWHEQNKMPVNPSREQRAKWHIAHTGACDCRKPTPNIQKLMDEFQNLTK